MRKLWILFAVTLFVLCESQTVTYLPPRPQVVEPSGSWDGPDGPWASFIFNVDSDSEGLHGQNFRAFPGFSLSILLVPVEGEYCNGSHTVNPVCTARGSFRPNASMSWEPAGSTNVLSAVGLSNFAVDKGSAQVYGTSNIGIGSSNPRSQVLAGRTVAGVDSKDFFMALFGLSNVEVSLGQLGTRATFLSTYVRDADAPSLSFSYTAGSYEPNNVTASVPPSLILGGYDVSRFDSSTTLKTSITNATSASNPFQFAVNLASITISPDPSANISGDTYDPRTIALSDSAVTLYVDPVTPQLWLPESACEVFEKAFRLEWNETAQLYLMNSSTHDWFVQSNRSVTFSLSTSRTNDDVKNFTLSSSTFDLRATWPLVESDSYYFPLKRSSGTNILGRVFLQETHILVDYERGYFNLSQTAAWTGQDQNLVAVLNNTYNAPTTTTTTKSANTSGLTKGAYGGIGAGLGITIIAVLLFLFWKQKWWPFHARRSAQESAAQYEKAELHGAAVPWVEAMGKERAELETKEHRYEMTGAGHAQGELAGSDRVHELDASNSVRETQYNQ